jgi:hypothetical protein
MNSESSQRPLLIEVGSLSYLDDALKSAHSFRKKYTNMLINIVVFTVFITVIGLFMAYSYRGVPSQEEMEEKNYQKQQYVLSKIEEHARYKREMGHEDEPRLGEFYN